MNSIVAVVQARMQSTRLKNKSLIHLKGFPIIYWVNNGLLKSKLTNSIIYALPNSKSDDVLSEYIRNLNQKVFRGDQKNVLNRIYNAAKSCKSKYIVRICADNPFISGKEIDNLIKFYFNNSYDYAYNHIPLNNKFPDGLGAEIVSFNVLKKLNDLVKDNDHKEHVFNYIWDNKNKFKIGTFDPEDKNIAYPNLKLDIDTQDELNFYSKIDFNINTETNEIIKKIREHKYEN
ncbi:spore coat biosynthesis protein F [Alphaproteobacteria bacterium]|jgi:spore coat polysaccharide biosynthesis protein SpsF|nr:spore coat biosynthesis protein F [Alphaproteobacteria bacterium]